MNVRKRTTGDTDTYGGGMTPPCTRVDLGAILEVYNGVEKDPYCFRHPKGSLRDSCVPK